MYTVRVYLHYLLPFQMESARLGENPRANLRHRSNTAMRELRPTSTVCDTLKLYTKFLLTSTGLAPDSKQSTIVSADLWTEEQPW
jgi:hypothetical protein